MSPAVS
jgi:hypothetical protein